MYTLVKDREGNVWEYIIINMQLITKKKIKMYKHALKIQKKKRFLMTKSLKGYFTVQWKVKLWATPMSFQVVVSSKNLFKTHQTCSSLMFFTLTQCAHFFFYGLRPPSFLCLFFVVLTQERKLML